MKFGFTPALNAQHAYVCRDSYALRCLIPARFKMKFRRTKGAPDHTNPSFTIPCRQSWHKHKSAFINTGSAKLAQMDANLVLLPKSGVFHLAFECLYRCISKVYCPNAAVCFGGVKWSFIAMFRLIVIVNSLCRYLCLIVSAA